MAVTKKQIDRFILKKEDVTIIPPPEHLWTKYGKAKKNGSA